jgi:hypothetical protein
MDFEWAYPIGHQDLTLEPSSIRTYYQPVAGRDNTRCSARRVKKPLYESKFTRRAEGMSFVNFN